MRVLLFIAIFSFFSVDISAERNSYGHTDPEVNILVFPNPCQDFIKIQASDESIALIRVRDVIGKEIVSFVFAKDDKYDISELRTGVYFVQLLDEHNNLIATRRVKKV